MDSFLKYFSPILSIAIGIAWLFSMNMPIYDINHSPSDSIAVANTYIVFVTFLVVVATVAISIAAVIYTKQYSQTKERLLTDNLEEMVEEFAKKGKLQDKLIEGILKNHAINMVIQEHLQSLSSNTAETINSMQRKLDDVAKERDEKIKEELLNFETRLKIEASIAEKRIVY